MKILLKSISIILLLTISSFGQIENLSTHTQMNLDCKKCHICDTPTKANPCLILCPRNKIDVVRHSPLEGPDKILIDIIRNEEDLYGPSSFTHRTHSEMSLMSGGCSTCHHFNPPGAIVKCSNCHETKRQRTDLSKPDLKAAFHRQCMGCHKTWEKESNCESCHRLNSNTITQKSEAKIVKSHPEISIPIKVVYETESEEGDFVTFFHNDHGSLFGNECSDCHDQESCASCHSEIKLESIKEDPHDDCSSCHETQNDCNKCHKENIAKPFNHSRTTGFSLTSYHKSLACNSCHKSKDKFTGLNGSCINCHKNDDDYFDHGISGLELDENHVDLDCSDCHQTNKYSKRPTCDDCHDDDISFPDSTPGERTK